MTRSPTGVLLALSTLLLFSTPALAQPKRKPPQPPEIRGISLSLHSKDPSFDYGPLLRELPSLGVNYVCVAFHVYQSHGGSPTPSRHATKTPSDGTIRAVLKEARRLKLEVALLPIVLLENPRPDDWRGNLSPPDRAGRVNTDSRYGTPDWSAWFKGYRKVTRHYARLAEECRASVFSVGSELSSSEAQVGEWRRVVAEVRKLFSGELTYSANWDHYEHVKIWKELDYIGLSGYYELTTSKSPTLKELKKSWRKVRDTILDWRTKAKLLDRPLLFTEIGYPSMDGCASKPWDYTLLDNPPDLREQALCYLAFVAAWDGRPELGGAVFYEWWGKGGRDDKGYTPRGKPALRVLRDWFRAE
ncbi:MAG: hypothetical protein JKY65_32105 [Planctomycetes bacterium]|nr:hypothetical protein [Planctomycetota bacterium]